MSEKKTRTRIAPSPTGEPHIGTAYTALFNYAFSKKNKGEFIIRVEDTDQSRIVEGAEDRLYEALDWLGLVSDEGPKTSGQFGPYKQSERLDIYQEKAAELLEKRAAYPCDCSAERLAKVREEQQKRGEVTHYDGKCRENPPSLEGQHVVRLKVPHEGQTSFTDVIRGEIKFQNSGIDDQVLLKSDGFPTYHLASVVDDHLMQISDVIRGEDWLSSTPKHVLLYSAFGWELPNFAHLPLLRNPDKSKLSKRKNPVSVLWYREQGYLPEALLNFLALMGWSMPDGNEVFDLSSFIANFDLKRVDPSGPVFDVQKLDWLNGHYIREMSNEDLFTRLVDGTFTKRTKQEVLSKLPLVKERMKKLSEFDQLTSFFFEETVGEKEKYLQKARGEVETRKLLEELVKTLQKTSWTEDNLEKEISSFQEKSDWTRKELFMMLRIVITGREATPPLFSTLKHVGKESTIKRLQSAINQLPA